jgi:hypothetical protein
MISAGKKALLASTLANRGGLVVEDVFSTYLYTGNGSTQTITNGIDLDGEGGLVWIKGRNAVTNHALVDTERGGANSLASDTTDAQRTDGAYGLTFNSDGFDSTGGNLNVSGRNQASWTFRKAPNFFDVVTYTGDGTGTRAIPHSLGIAPGMFIVKNTGTTSSWYVYHKDGVATTYTGAETYGVLNSTNAWTDNAAIFGDTEPTDAVFTVGLQSNQSANTYVAYLFAHDTSDEGFIQCGSFTTDGSGNATIDLGWEPQFLITKSTTSVDGWRMTDSSRGFTASSGGAERIFADTSAAAGGGQSNPLLNASGFSVASYTTNDTNIYMAIRRGPMRQPTAGTDVYNTLLYTGNFTSNRVLSSFGLFLDAVIFKNRVRGFFDINDYVHIFASRITNSALETQKTKVEGFSAAFDFGYMDTVELTNLEGVLNPQNSDAMVAHGLKRAPGVFDVVAYTGDDGTDTAITHGLGVIPEMIIVKSRSSAQDWMVQHSGLAASNSYIRLNLTAGETANAPGIGVWGSAPTATAFYVDDTGNTFVTNHLGATYIAYLFATLAGISKVGSYTGDGTTGKVIDCGFTTGARFILIKRTDSTGDWYLWDSVRGIVAGNDPHLSLNTITAEVTTDDSVDPDSSGFIVNQNATTNINVTSATYIFLAFA